MSSRRPGLRRTIQVVVIALVAYWIILPLVPQFFDAAHDLNRIEPNLLLAGFGLQMISLFFYSMLTKAALGEHGDEVTLLRLFRIQLSTKALGNVMPGGSAASTALGLLPSTTFKYVTFLLIMGYTPPNCFKIPA